MPPITQRQQAQGETGQYRQPGQPVARPAQRFAEHQDAGAEQRGGGVDFLAQDRRHAVEQHVAGDAAADCGGGAEEDRHLVVVAVGQRLVRAGDGEHAEAERVEQQHRVGQTLDQRAGPDRDQRGEHRGGQIAPVAQADRWGGADAQVAHHAATDRGDEGDHHHAEQVEAPLQGCGGATDGTGEDPGEIQRDEQALGVHASAASAHNQAEAAVSMACRPVFRVGCSTGAYCGEWLPGMALSCPRALASR
ncbi:hypothetical protein D3C78_635820 [compost metagenome]